MRIAIVHDDFVQWGGAERLVKAWAEVWPQADIYTVQYAPLVGELSWLQQRRLVASFVQRIPGHIKLYKTLFWLYPLAVESFDLRGYDVVLSSSARFAHGVITAPETLHIAYINSPPRMLWEEYSYFAHSWLRLGLAPLLHLLRLWDFVAGQRPDWLIANSHYVAAKIEKRYHRQVTKVIHPFTEIAQLYESTEPCREEVGFLVVSRLLAWKQLALVIKVFNDLGLPLTIIGQGPDYHRLHKLAGPTINFKQGLTDEEVASYYLKSIALLHPQEEDFGLTPLEAMALGKGVIAYQAGGALETVVAGVTGEFFKPQTAAALKKVILAYQPQKYHPETCRAVARKFSKDKFILAFQELLKGKNT